MPDSDRPFPRWTSIRAFRHWSSIRAEEPSAEELIERAQRLSDTPRPPGGHSLEWCVEAKHVGDLNAIAIASLRAPIGAPRSNNGKRKPN